QVDVVAAITEEYPVLTSSGGIDLGDWQTWGSGTPTFNTASISMTTSGFGGWGFFPPQQNKSHLRPLSLEFTVDTDVNLTIGMEDLDNGPSTVEIADYGWNGQSGPQAISIPVAHFKRELNELVSPFQVTAAESATFTLSDILWTLPSLSDQAPFFTSAPVTTGAVGVPYSYDARATDANGPPLTYNLAAGPAGIYLDPVTGRLLWLPEPADEGPHPVTLVVTDFDGNSAQQSFSLEIAAAPSTIQTFRFDGVVSELGTGSHGAFAVGLPFFIEFTFDNSIPDSNELNFAQTFAGSIQSFTFNLNNGVYIGTGNDLDITVNNGGGVCASIYGVFGNTLLGDDISFAPLGGFPLTSFSLNLCDEDQQSFGTTNVPQNLPFDEIEQKTFVLNYEMPEVVVTGELTAFSDITAQYGDVNQDGNISAIDASLTARHAVG
ncbi:MAG: putative Ig domain-containing protein, partial [Candidatus Omnitrophica bacterium]|nr:putative Ig domain-containing protein [Candidatus Omnitrophota bacterium]